MVNVITVENLSKKYMIAHQRPERYTALRDVLTNGIKRIGRKVLTPFSRRKGGNPAYEEFWAIKDVCLEVKEGERIGIIGRNGAGKSTLLKILSRVTEPTAGRVTIKGRVSSLLEVGTGFHPELTGRENIFLNGVILGMKSSEIKKNFDAIIDFAGIEKFLDTPVKRYSSGMYVRLAFAVAAHLDSEIMIVDEVLAVGDAQFQKKCLDKMQNVSNSGRTVLFVSHNMAAIQHLCNFGIVLSSGRAVFSGKVQDAIQHYLGSTKISCLGRVDMRNAQRWESPRQIILTWVSTHRMDGSQTTEFATGEGIIVKIGYSLNEEILSAFCQINILNILGERIMTLRSSHNGPALELSGEGVIQCEIPDIRLVSGEYILMLEIGRHFPSESLDCIPDAIHIHIYLGDYLRGYELQQGQGIIAQRSGWSIFAVERMAV